MNKDDRVRHMIEQSRSDEQRGLLKWCSWRKKISLRFYVEKKLPA